MDKLIRLLFENPILLFIIGAWVFGAISNAAKAKNKAGGSAQRRRSRKRRSAEEQQTMAQQTMAQPLPDLAQQRAQRRSPSPSPPPPSTAARAGGRLAGSAAQTPEQIAREMRRILGLEAPPAAPPPGARSPAPAPPPLERPPEPVRVSLDSTRIETRVDPHVGEGIRDRHLRESMVGKARAGRGAIGNLGGRVSSGKRAVGRDSRYALDDLRKAIVISEILSPPVSLRSHDDRRPS
jgi:hypothetical protein